MKWSRSIFGALLAFTFLLLQIQTSKGLQCYNCAHIKVDGKDIGDPTCLHGGASKYLVECNDQMEMPSPIPGKRVTLGDIRRKHGIGRNAIYSCAETNIDAKLSGKDVTLLMRSCGFSKNGPKPECKSGTKKDWVSDKNIPVESFKGLGDDDRIQICTCYKDGCSKPAEERRGHSSSGSTPFYFTGRRQKGEMDW